MVRSKNKYWIQEALLWVKRFIENRYFSEAIDIYGTIIKTVGYKEVWDDRCRTLLSVLRNNLLQTEVYELCTTLSESNDNAAHTLAIKEILFESLQLDYWSDIIFKKISENELEKLENILQSYRKKEWESTIGTKNMWEKIEAMLGFRKIYNQKYVFIVNIFKILANKKDNLSIYWSLCGARILLLNGWFDWALEVYLEALKNRSATDKFIFDIYVQLLKIFTRLSSVKMDYDLESIIEALAQRWDDFWVRFSAWLTESLLQYSSNNKKWPNISDIPLNKLDSKKLQNMWGEISKIESKLTRKRYSRRKSAVRQVQQNIAKNAIDLNLIQEIIGWTKEYKNKWLSFEELEETYESLMMNPTYIPR